MIKVVNEERGFAEVIGVIVKLVLKNIQLVVDVVLRACVVIDVLGPMVGNQFAVDDLDELDVVDVVAGAHAQTESFNILLSERKGKWRWFAIVVSVVLVLIRGVRRETALCVEAG